MLGIFFSVILVVHLCDSSYIITSPRQWTAGEKNQVCINVPDEEISGGVLEVGVHARKYNYPEDPINVTLLPTVTLAVKPGKHKECHELYVPYEEYYNAYLTLNGNIHGSEVNESLTLRVRKADNLTFVQTDKHLYQKGQKVQFRILTLYGAKAQVATEEYPLVWVTSPSQNRIAQWKHVDNSAGLVHLDFLLADEPEEGTYQINVKDSSGRTTYESFKVEEYVLPRFEVKVTVPKYILATDEKFTFSACAKYVFGQSVVGNMTIEVTNNERKRCLVTLRKTEKVNGCMEFEVTARALRVMDCSVYRLQATATMVEEGIAISEMVSDNVHIERTPITLTAIYEDKYKKPNLPYFVELQATLPDKAPAPGVPMEVCYAGRCTNTTTDHEGMVTAAVMDEDSQNIIMTTTNCRANVRTTSYSKSIQPFYSPSNSSLLIRVPQGKLKCSSGRHTKHLLTILYSANNQPSAHLHAQVVSRGRIQWTGSRPVNFPPTDFPSDVQINESYQKPASPIVTGSMSFPITLTPSASPTVQVLIWYKRDDGEVVSDSAQLKVDKCLPTTADLSWSTEKVQPGEEATLSLLGEGHAVCSIGVVDKSTELLNPDPHPINLDAIFDYLDGYQIGPYINSQIDTNRYCERKAFLETEELLRAASDDPSLIISIPVRPGYYSSEYVDTLQMFDDSGLYAISDLTLETRPCIEEPYRRHYETSSYDIMRTMGSEVSLQSVQVRSFFPETWLWDLVVLPPTGTLEQKLTLPDTITEWVGKAVCAHTEKGVGISEKVSITTFTPFFTDLTLPPSVKRGEVLPVKISVFNYLENPLPVRLTLEESEEYEVVDDQGLGNMRELCLTPEDKEVHTIKIRPLALGQVKLKVHAHAGSSISIQCNTKANVDKRDILLKDIQVDAEGFFREEAHTTYLCAEDGETVWGLFPPSLIVPDSERGWVTAVGDLLALSLENLGSLIRMPYGCGEQNMVNFAPNIFIMQYLDAAREEAPESRQKLLRYMKTGYQRQLLYRHGNGSYSAFGSADDSGSTWLTAFVLKSFTQAQEFIYIDEKSLNETKNWLLGTPLDETGCVIPVGKVFSKGLKGGLASRGSSVPMTAYILIALLESGTVYNDILLSTTNCVLVDTSSDPYTLALKAYALALAERPEATTVLQGLLDQGIEDIDGIHWSIDEYSYKSKALTVETAGYAILAMMALNPEQHTFTARKVVRWITSQRNGQGGFYSTQDTVIALQAIARFEALTYQGPLDAVVKFVAFSEPEHSSYIQQSQQSQQVQFEQLQDPYRDADFVHDFYVNEDNKFLLKQETLPRFPTYVKVKLEGQGCAVMQGVLRYNIPEAEPSDAFSLSVDTQTSPWRDCMNKRIKACASYLLPDEKSNMAVLEVNLVSGFIPVKGDLKSAVRHNNLVKRYEVDGSKVSFYIEELTAEEVCISFLAIREVEIEDAKPGSVSIYDYYQPEFVLSKSYTFPYVEGCNE